MSRKISPLLSRTVMLASLASVAAATAGAQTSLPKGPAATTKSVGYSSTKTTAAAWAFPDPDLLIERVIARIVSQDKPNAIPVAEYTERLFGREETLAAVRQFAGHPVSLRPTSFGSVKDWTVVSRQDYKPCFGDDCAMPVNSLWLAVTKIERGELPHELHVWYTTSFASHGPAGPARHTYAFCERWLRVNGTWKYDGFVRVNSL